MTKPEYGVSAATLMTLPVATTLQVARDAEAMGYRSIWLAETTGLEAFSVMGALTQVAPSLGVGTGVLALQLRTPGIVAMGAATLQAMAPDNDVCIGIGISSPVVAGRWHGADYGNRPLAQVREFVQVVRECLSGERVDFDGDFYSVSGFRLAVRLGERKPKIVVGALNEGMLKLGGEVADGVLLNYLPASHVPWSVEQVRKGGDAKIYAYIHVGVTDRDEALVPAKRDLFSYAVVDSYAKSFARAGYGDAVAEIRRHHQAKDRDAAIAAVSDSMVDGINIVGDAGHVRGAVQAYIDAGVEVPLIFPLPWGRDRSEVVRQTLEAAIDN